MSGILLSSNIRSNLLALQGTAQMLDQTQERLSTGKKVNSALDNATSYFTSQNLSDRASNLTTLQDGISNGLSTLKQANQGLTTITSLLKSAKAIAQSAKSSGAGATSYSATATTAQTTGTDATNTKTLAATSAVVSTANGVAANDKITFSSTDSKGVVSTFTFDTKDWAAGDAGVTDGTHTVGDKKSVQDLADAVNASGVANVKINDNGTLSFSSTGNLKVNVTGADGTTASTATSILGFGTTGTPLTTAGEIDTVQGTSGDSTTDYTSQLSDLLQSINDTANDSNYNGINLLVGGDNNKLSVSFDDKSSSHLDVDSTDVTTNGLGVTAPSTLDASTADDLIKGIDAALGKVQSLASSYGTKQTIMQSRADFTANTVTNLQSGSDALVSADTNEEAANVLALQTRQSLSQSALSLANQANQAVLQLLR